MNTRVTLLVLLAGLALPAQAEQLHRYGNYEVHYNAVSTASLLPEVARGYQIVRSKQRGLLTVSVLKKGAGAAQPVAAKIEAGVVLLTGQVEPVAMREVREGEAIYYLGEFRVNPPEPLRFSIRVTPTGEPKPEKFDYTQKFF